MRFTNRTAVRVGLATVAAGALAAGALTLVTSAGASPSGAAAARAMGMHAASSHPVYGFGTADNTADLTFNQLLGINNDGLTAGYDGSDVQGHPNTGYVLGPGGYRSENFPGSVQTQVTGLNNTGVTVGFWSNTNMGVGKDANFGWVNVYGHFRKVNFPTNSPASPALDQNLGVNDEGIVVGFYNDNNNASHGYEYNIWTRQFSTVVDPNSPGASLTAAAINDHGDVAGFYTNPATGNTEGFLLRDGQFMDLAVAGASSTMALGVNNYDEVVGVYTPSGTTVLHGFTWTPRHGFTTVDDPKGIATTTINGVNDFGQLVGFYSTDGGNITNGFLATPHGH